MRAVPPVGRCPAVAPAPQRRFRRALLAVMMQAAVGAVVVVEVVASWPALCRACHPGLAWVVGRHLRLRWRKSRHPSAATCRWRRMCATVAPSAQTKTPLVRPMVGTVVPPAALVVAAAVEVVAPPVALPVMCRRHRAAAEVTAMAPMVPMVTLPAVALTAGAVVEMRDPGAHDRVATTAISWPPPPLQLARLVPAHRHPLPLTSRASTGRRTNRPSS